MLKPFGSFRESRTEYTVPGVSASYRAAGKGDKKEGRPGRDRIWSALFFVDECQEAAFIKRRIFRILRGIACARPAKMVKSEMN